MNLVDMNFLIKGSFVCEYAGEIISAETAKKRSKKDKMNYILYVVENFHREKKRIFAIDPTSIGNIGRYINHSCDPNLSKKLVYVDEMYPRVALMAKTDIRPGTELTFDYGSIENRNSLSENGGTKCLCGSKNCQGFLPFHQF